MPLGNQCDLLFWQKRVLFTTFILMRKDILKYGRVSFFLLIVLTTSAFAQEYRVSNKIVVKDLNGQKQNMAWSGGFDNPHPHNMDLNGDGRMDVVMAEMSNSLKKISFVPFVHLQGEEFRYAPEYEQFFENCDCFEWAILKDYNQDSVPDIFCGRNPGSNFKVYQGIQHCQDSFSYVLQRDPLNYQRNSVSDTVPVVQNRTDIPGVADVDFDGDVDLVTSNAFNGRLTYYRNFDVENGNPPGTLEYSIETYCWGHFSENNLDENLALGDTTSFGCGVIYPWNRTAAPRHAGTTITLLDTNGDSLIEVLMGDVDYPWLILIQNQGRKIEAFMNKAIYRYPLTDSSAFMPQFLKTSHLDLNGDGLLDLAVTPHDLDASLIENKSFMLWYENTGIPNLVNFSFRDRTLFAGQGIDVGYESLPEFLDYNNDGLMDICVGARISSDLVNGVIRNSTPFYIYENIGTPGNPEFRFVSDNYIDFNLGPPFINAPEPAAGDLDNDGDTDLLIGASDGRIYHYVNQATSGPTADFQLSSDVLLRDKDNVPIIVVNNAAPELHDYDSDGDLDLFIGNGLGKVYYYENIGTPTAFSFELKTNHFGKILIRNAYGDTLDIVRPAFGDVNGDGNADLIVGGEAGFVEIFTDAYQALQKPLSKSDTLLDRRFRGRISPAVAKLDESDDLYFVIGTEEGGLILVQKDTLSYDFCQLPDTTQDTTKNGTFVLNPKVSFVEVFPNPAREQVTIRFNEDTGVGLPRQASIVNGMGQVVKQVRFSGDSYRWDLSGLNSGLYLLELSSGNKRSIHKLLIRK